MLQAFAAKGAQYAAAKLDFKKLDELLEQFENQQGTVKVLTRVEAKEKAVTTLYYQRGVNVTRHNIQEAVTAFVAFLATHPPARLESDKKVLVKRKLLEYWPRQASANAVARDVR